MVSLRNLFEDNNITFIAGRRFRFNGVDYRPGDQLDRQEVRDARTREALLRSSRAIAVTDDLNNVPRAFRKEIKDRELALKKLGVPFIPAEPGEGFDPDDYTIDQVKEYLEGKDLAEHERVLDLEMNGKNRSTLTSWLADEIERLEQEQTPEEPPTDPEPGGGE